MDKVMFENFLKMFDKKKLRVEEEIDTIDMDEWSVTPLDKFIFELQSINIAGYIDVGLRLDLDYGNCYYEGDRPSVRLRIIGSKEETDEQYLARAKQCWKMKKG